MARSELEQLYGTTEAPAEWLTLSAGPLAADLENGQLRYVRFGGIEVLRAVSFLARDRYWGTFGADISGLTITSDPARFTVRYAARCAPDEGDLRYEVEIVGEAAGRLSFAARGAPVADFLTNRTGFVVLHPLDGVAGSAVEIDHASGGTETTILPDAISPDEPAKDILAITHEPVPGLRVRVEMTGDAYDMEDQRNWTDASFKTYIRPLSKPKPYTMLADEQFEQSVTVRISGAVPTKARTGGNAIIEQGEQIGVMPRIALGIDGADADRSRHPLPPGIAAIVGRPTTPDDIPELAALARGTAAELSLQFAIPGHDPAAELKPWAGTDAGSVLVVPHRLYPLRPPGHEPGRATLAEIARAARVAFPEASIGGGVMTGFTEFNRNRPPLAEVDFVSHVTSAIVHAADDRSVIESLEALPQVFQSASALSSGKPYRIGPSGIGLCLNPDGPPRRADAAHARATMIRDDPRQRGLFAAAWTLGYAVAVVTHGIDEYAPAHIAGDFGIFDDDSGMRPIYHVVRALAAHTSGEVFALSGLPRDCKGLAFGGGFWITNLSPIPRRLQFGRSMRAAVLDTSSFEEARHKPAFFERLASTQVSGFDLRPYAVARVEP